MILNRRVLITLRKKVRVKTSGGGGRERRDVEDGEKERRRIGRGGRGAMTRRKQRISIRRKSRIKQRRMGRRELPRIHGGKCGIIRETDMRRPEFTAWLAEVKQGVPVSHTSWKPQVNQETLSNWEEKQMFKEFMGDHNTAIFPSKKCCSLARAWCEARMWAGLIGLPVYVSVYLGKN
ncbi:PREDICTED: uncharacterized protein LOC104586420 isoform X1 [Nelumbo nucifera]|uniref:Uncharacterized protein LOC104586420 isoform X1 n=1 Tax=Nelumbo nucifera TaxID=4432 RepID=A0A1U8PXX4_NELNU|nr:PREDICTED: uncharacterized protein LOC104586420 isoform X1 [Nelumbo nucifera]